MRVGYHDTDVLYLTDFGLVSSFLDQDGTHIKKERVEQFEGNFLFASLNSCRYYNRSRRDDIESALYLLIYLINRQKLPWMGLARCFKGKKMHFNDFLQHRMNKTYTHQLFDMVPVEMRLCLMKTLCLKFDQEPPYDLILESLMTCHKKAVASSGDLSFKKSA